MRTSDVRGDELRHREARGTSPKGIGGMLAVKAERGPFWPQLCPIRRKLRVHECAMRGWHGPCSVAGCPVDGLAGYQ